MSDSAHLSVSRNRDWNSNLHNFRSIWVFDIYIELNGVVSRLPIHAVHERCLSIRIQILCISLKAGPVERESPFWFTINMFTKSDFPPNGRVVSICGWQSKIALQKKSRDESPRASVKAANKQNPTWIQSQISNYAPSCSLRKAETVYKISRKWSAASSGQVWQHHRGSRDVRILLTVCCRFCCFLSHVLLFVCARCHFQNIANRSFSPMFSHYTVIMRRRKIALTCNQYRIYTAVRAPNSDYLMIAIVIIARLADTRDVSKYSPIKSFSSWHSFDSIIHDMRPLLRAPRMHSCTARRRNRQFTY